MFVPTATASAASVEPGWGVILSFTFLALAWLYGILVYLPKWWRGKTRLMDEVTTRPWWPSGDAVRRGSLRLNMMAFVAVGFGLLSGALLVVGDHAPDPAKSSLHSLAWYSLLAFVGCWPFLISIAMFNRPKRLVAPHLRDEPGAIAVWFSKKQPAGEMPRSQGLGSDGSEAVVKRAMAEQHELRRYELVLVTDAYGRASQLSPPEGVWGYLLFYPDDLLFAAHPQFEDAVRRSPVVEHRSANSISGVRLVRPRAKLHGRIWMALHGPWVQIDTAEGPWIFRVDPRDRDRLTAEVKQRYVNASGGGGRLFDDANS